MGKLLRDNQVYVFGSNLNGYHDGGDARYALDNLGAVYGVSQGINGRSYAFPVLGYNLEQLTDDELESSRDNLFDTARSLPSVTFILSKVGYGIAGYPEQMMQNLFAGSPANIKKPEGWL